VRKLNEIIKAVEEYEDVTYDEYYWSLLVLISLMTSIEADLRGDIDKNKIIKELYDKVIQRKKIAFDKNPKIFLLENDFKVEQEKLIEKLIKQNEKK
jgi:hypothetical protein